MNQSTFNWDVFQDTGKFNTSVKLTESDKKHNFKIYCMEPYAQDVYNKLVAFETNSKSTSYKKDITAGEVCKVRANTISYTDKMIYAEDINSKCTIAIPFREYSKDLDTLSNSREFLVTVYKVTEHGEYFGSEKKALSISYKQELYDHFNNNTWFDVKIMKLIKGGYLAIYNKEIECFIPGSHAAANIVHNFSDLLGKTLTVMVDNYDASNDLFILSYKKYVTQSMPVMISELCFDKEYEGTLTATPYDFGVFVEFEGYYTGLIHMSEFEDYAAIRTKLRTGDKISFYIKDVTSKKGQYRIVLTLNKDQVNTEKIQWQTLRNRTENQSFKYTVDKSNSSISIDVDGEHFEVSLKRSDLDKNLAKYPLVKVFKVDPINKRLKFEFVEDES
jgi:ribosomal protein S1